MKEIEFLENKIFEGIVTHERLKPFSHNFKYYASYFWFDIRKFKNTLLFKKNKFSLFSFYENDHGDPDVKYLKLYDSIIKKCEDIFAKKMKDYGSAWSILRISS